MSLAGLLHPEQLPETTVKNDGGCKLMALRFALANEL